MDDTAPLKGYCHDNFAAFLSNCGTIMTQNLCSKQETLLKPQEENIRDSPREGKPVCFFSGDISHSQWQNLKMTFSSCSPYLTVSSLAYDNNK